MKGMWVIVDRVNGPAGHGEPGMEYIALASIAGAYEIPVPAPGFQTKEAAESFMKTQKQWWSLKAVIFIPFNQEV